jgi:RNA polymerase sigma-70 factor (ECF subfamily)
MSRDSLETVSDEWLAAAVGRNDEPALAEIYRRYGGAMISLAKRVLRDHAMAEEVVQEVLLRLWRRPERFDGGRGTLRTFLLGDVHGRSVDIVRSEVARKRREERDAVMTLHEHAEAPEAGLLEQATATALREAIAGLAEGEREAIELAYFGGHSYREVAEMLDQPEGTIKSRIRSGLARLGQDLSTAEVRA